MWRCGGGRGGGAGAGLSHIALSGCLCSRRTSPQQRGAPPLSSAAAHTSAGAPQPAHLSRRTHLSCRAGRRERRVGVNLKYTSASVWPHLRVYKVINHRTFEPPNAAAGSRSSFLVRPVEALHGPNSLQHPGHLTQLTLRLGQLCARHCSFLTGYHEDLRCEPQRDGGLGCVVRARQPARGRHGRGRPSDVTQSVTHFHPANRVADARGTTARSAA